MWRSHVARERRGGEGEIRTLDNLAAMPDFESGAFDHSATSPCSACHPALRPRRTALRMTPALCPPRAGKSACSRTGSILAKAGRM